MTPLQKTNLKLSETRQAINKLLNTESEMTTEDRAELKTLTEKMDDLETEYRAAVKADADFTEKAAGEFSREFDDGEGTEIRNLKQRCSLFNYANAALKGGTVQGAEAELNQALNIQHTGGVSVPVAMLAGEEHRQTEHRADAVSSTTQLDGGLAQRSIMQRLFGAGILDFMGVRLDSVPAGMTEYPLLTGGAVAEMLDESGTVEADAVTFQVQSLKPKRLTARYLYTYEQSAQIPQIEAVFRRDLADVIRSKMSDQVIGGSGAAPNVTGFLSRLTAPGDPDNATTYQDFLTMLGSGVDGLHATTEMQVKMLLGTESYAFAVGVVRSGVMQHATQGLREISGGLMATTYLPAAASNVQGALLHAGDDLMRGDSVGAVWPSIELIRDQYSNAADGQVALTAITLWDCYTAFRASAYKRLKIKIA